MQGGQCAKLKCCMNYEVDSYVEAQKHFPSRDVELETKDNTYYFFKADILARQITYSTDKVFAANVVTIPAERALEIIAMNRNGIKPESLRVEPEPEAPEFITAVGDDSISRFDAPKRRKSHGRGRKGKNHQRGDKSENKA